MFNKLINKAINIITNKTAEPNWKNESVPEEIQIAPVEAIPQPIKWRHYVDVQRVTSPFGYRTLPGIGKQYHNGTDYTSIGNTYAFAPCSCVVTQVLQPDAQYPYRFAWTRENGWKLRTDIPKGRAWTPFVVLTAIHDPSIVFVYRHGKSLVNVGDKVSVGDKVITIDNFGFSQGAHLHAETLINGKEVNPDVFIKEKLGGIV
jgi:murein DD-endopeptidase MepM/ murein hydrolase activator NlpD